ncbi:MAG: hypothetical protein A3H96_02105 [Acidobacteria bacterium RIFCSPLOWO2_02_FULL_67_36]|nr:MAG: hypothetical protein A3H96_02105 [Acidobacteria bacterium RIFCSPLOWO2_02_FULL_67_36]OFW21375.1 MAG: hypothetical protein A3G21_11980 [Acidobacteria bacterium RIFCSPLOWO2_12_FULL_66_21]
MRCPLALVAALLVLGPSGIANAQTSPARRGYVAVKGGFNHESAEDGLNATAGAGGLAAGISFGRALSGEVEVWVPAVFRDAAGDPKHRDIPVSLSIVRTVREGRVRPYVLAGLSGARTETSIKEDSDG